MAKTEKSLVHEVAQEVGAVIDWWTAPATNTSIAWGMTGFNMMLRAFMPKTAPSSFGKEQAD